MKKNSIRLLALSLPLILLSGFQAASSVDLDRKYALETISYLRSFDNVDGVFAQYVDQAYQLHLKSLSRFRLKDPHRADEIIQRSKLSYQKIIDDKDILNTFARALRVETLIRTRIVKKDSTYHFTLDWLQFPGKILLATNELEFEEPEPGTALGTKELNESLAQGLDRLFAKVPFIGQVSGRDKDWLTLNVGREAHLNIGDTVLIKTIDDVKKHPLTSSLVEWTMVPTGKARVETIDEKVVFARILEEEEDHPIARFQKVAQVIPAEAIAAPKNSADHPQAENASGDLSNLPKLGFVDVGAWLGTFGRSYGTKDGSGLAFGGHATGQIWLTRAIFAEGRFGYGLFSYSQTDTDTETTAEGSGNITRLGFALGYQYYLKESIFGPKVYGKVGYRAVSYGLPTNATELLGSSNFSSIFIGVGGELPLREKWGLKLDLEFGLMSSVSESGFQSAASSSGVSDVGLFVGGFYRLEPNITLKAGIDLLLDSAEFGTASFQHNAILFSPSVLFYF